MLAARVREDKAEADRLERTCPRKAYSLPDAAYLERRELVEFIALVVCLGLTQYLAKLEVTSAFGWAARELRERSLNAAEGVADHAKQQAADQSEADQAEDWREASSLLVRHAVDPLDHVAARLDDDFARQARGVWDGFARFCRTELRMEPETVIGAYFTPMLARLDGQREGLDAAEPDRAMVDEYARELTEGWRRIVGQ